MMNPFSIPSTALRVRTDERDKLNEMNPACTTCGCGRAFHEYGGDEFTPAFGRCERPGCACRTFTED